MTTTTENLRALADKPAWTRGQQDQWGKDARDSLRAAADLIDAQQRASDAAQQYQIGTEVTDAIAAALTSEPQQETP